MPNYDIAVLGAGPGGYVAALRAALRGARVCCIESAELGGSCLNRGCIPTKAMLHASDLLTHAARFAEFGLACQKPSVNPEAFMARVAKVVVGLRQGVDFLLKKRKVDVIAGHGRLTSRDTLLVRTASGEVPVQAKSIIIATGSRPVRPGFAPWNSGRVMTTDEAATANGLPESILIVGGGVIGCEFATIYSELGIPTTLIEMLDRLVFKLDDEVSAAITRSLERRRVKILTGARIAKLTATDTGIVAEMETGPAVQAACALVAVGRAPNVENLGLEQAGIALDGAVIKVDDHCRTNVGHIYAVGDAAEMRQYAHLASRMGIVAADNATGHPNLDTRSVVPEVVYTHPEAATVGLSEREAREKYPDVRVARFPYSAVGMARAYGDPEGGVKIIAEPGGRILGAAVIGRNAYEIIQEFTLALRHELTVEKIAETIHPHPTFNEAVHEAAEAWLGLPLHAAL